MTTRKHINLAHDHEWTDDVVPEFTPVVGPYHIESRYVGGQWESEGSGDVYDSLEAAEAAMAVSIWTADDDGSLLEYRCVTVRS